MPVQDEAPKSDDRRSLHLLVQQVQTPAGYAYRLIAYGGGDSYFAPEFQTPAAVLSRLRDAAPDLEVSSMVTDASTTSIIFSAEVHLTETQRTRLGLVPALR